MNLTILLIYLLSTLDTRPCASSQSATAPAVLLPMSLDKAFGFVDAAGTVKIGPRFGYADGFYEGRAAVVVGVEHGRRVWAYVDTSGAVIGDARYEKAGRFAEGLAPVLSEGKLGFIDRSGNIVVKPQYDGASGFSQELATVWVGRKYGFINKDGQEVIPAKFDWAGDFHEGLAVIRVGNRSGYIDKKGELKLPPKFDSAREFSEGLAYVVPGRTNLGQYIDVTGKVIIDNVYGGGSFHEGLARVSVREKYGFIGKDGKIAVQPSFAAVQDFACGRAGASVDGKTWGFIDRKGKFVVKPVFDWVHGFEGGFAQVSKGGVMGYTRGDGSMLQVKVVAHQTINLGTPYRF